MRRAVYPDATMSSTSRRLNITLDEERAAKLAQLAERTHVQEGTLARSLLSSVLDQAESNPSDLVELLDRVPGAYERAQLGIRQASSGETVPLDRL